MKGISLKRTVNFVVIFLIVSSFSFALPQNAEAREPAVKLKAYAPYTLALDYLHLLSDQLRAINIELEVEYINLFDYIYMGYMYAGDISFIRLLGGEYYDPDYTGVYNENGSLNVMGYRTEMDWDNDLGTGKNEWYMKYGRHMYPPYSNERIQHYWNWEQYLMDDLLICQPLFVEKEYQAHWTNLEGYNISKGLIQSWGNMNWDGSHSGQASSNEFVVNDYSFCGYSPNSLVDCPTPDVPDYIFDPLIWYDGDASANPHLAENFTYLDNKTIEITCRQGIKWASDPDGNFTDEYFDAEDVYFTYAIQTELRNRYDVSWIESLELIDKYTLRIHIDEDYLVDERKFNPDYFSTFGEFIMPEHYLNQTQLGDGVTPDMSHLSWEIFQDNPFGTGLFEISSIDVDIGMTLTERADCWWLNTSITNDPALDWENRFGDFSGDINQIRIRNLYIREIILEEFSAGQLSIIDIYGDEVKLADNTYHPDFDMQDRLDWGFTMFTYNCRPQSATGNKDPCPNDPSITKGLALRKAISYCMDRQEINEVLYGGYMHITDYPIAERLSIWCNPKIQRYDRNLEFAQEYMYKAGYASLTIDVGFDFLKIITGISIINVFALIVIKRKYKQKG
ncbi:MAG: ABC transporter substrate-binding protein [Candidatus Heimdallarchaeota archaeon]